MMKKKKALRIKIKGRGKRFSPKTTGG